MFYCINEVCCTTIRGVAEKYCLSKGILSQNIERFADKVRPLAKADQILLAGDSLAAFELPKTKLEHVALNSLDESMPFAVECAPSDVAISATLSQKGRPTAFLSSPLHGSELHYPVCEKEAKAIIEALKKWSYLLTRSTFTFNHRSTLCSIDA